RIHGRIRHLPLWASPAPRPTLFPYTTLFRSTAFGEDEVRPSFDVRTIGSSIQVDRRFTRASRTLYRYSLKDVDLSDTAAPFEGTDRKSTRLNSSHVSISDAAFCLKKKKYLKP